MKTFPEGEVETARSIVRVLSFYLVLCAIIFVGAYILDSLDSSFARSVKIAYHEQADLFLGFIWLTHLFVAGVITLLSLTLMFGERNRRDVRYGCVGITVAIVSFGVLLLPCCFFLTRPRREPTYRPCGRRLKAE